MRRLVRSPKSGPDLPRPREMEPKTEFVARFGVDAVVMRTYPTKIKRARAAEQAWAKAKGESTVSITTSVNQFLLF